MQHRNGETYTILRTELSKWLCSCILNKKTLVRLVITRLMLGNGVEAICNDNAAACTRGREHLQLAAGQQLPLETY